MKSHQARIVLARTMSGQAHVLASDSATVAFDVEEIGSNAQDVGVIADPSECAAAAFWLWEGTIRNIGWASISGEGDEPEYAGSIRPILATGELERLLRMTPPEEAKNA